MAAVIASVCESNKLEPRPRSFSASFHLNLGVRPEYNGYIESANSARGPLNIIFSSTHSRRHPLLGEKVYDDALAFPQSPPLEDVVQANGSAEAESPVSGGSVQLGPCVEANGFVLPRECLEKVFSFLSPIERGVAAKTCRSWSTMIGHPSMWPVVDLTVFPACPLSATSSVRRHVCTLQCYYAYRTRLTLFMRYLIKIKPTIHIFKFTLDIGDVDDGWNDLLSDLIKCCGCKQMSVAELNWSETPSKKPFLTPDTSVTWSNSDYRELTFRRRQRQRQFTRFFDMFTSAAPNLTILRLPFDWSDRSVKSLARLHSLQILELRKYFMYGYVEPAMLRSVIQSAGELKHLTLEVLTERYGGGLTFYAVESQTLESLDVTACRGVYISEMSLPRLIEFYAARRPVAFHDAITTGYVNAAQDPEPPCMRAVLSRGAPGLRKLNEHQLSETWCNNDGCAELENALGSVCSCPAHKAAVAVGMDEAGDYFVDQASADQQ